MRRCLNLFSTLLFLSALCSASLAASQLDAIQARGELVFGTSGSMPTMSMLNESGKAAGFDVDMARLMADALDVKLTVRIMPFGELIDAVAKGEVDVAISNITMTSKRNLKVAFVGPYLTSGKCVVTKNETLAQADKNSVDLNTPETRLATMKASTSEAFVRQLFPNATVIAVDSYASATDMVARNEVSGLLTDYPICLATLKQNPDAGFVSLFSLLTYEPIGIALPPGDAQFINWTENFLKRLDGTDTLKGLSKRWFGRSGLAR
jgi:polar amino acid transport system substrate-binding protein